MTGLSIRQTGTGRRRKEVRLCRLDDIADGGSAGFGIETAAGRRALMAVRRGDKVHVYVNRCPHTRAPLDFTPGKFLTHDGAHILCSNHGALFRIRDGFCVAGPCAGESLEAAEAVVRDGVVTVLD